jgi:starch synthase
MSPLKLCVLSSEIEPYAKSGGLADVSSALTRGLRLAGHEVRAFMPLYPIVRQNGCVMQPVVELQQITIHLGGTPYVFSVKTATMRGTDIPIYFIDCAALFDRPMLYSFEPDEHRRFILFTRAVLESCRRLLWAPDIFHCNDWHTAFLPMFLRTMYAGDTTLTRSKSVLTIHNIAYQGTFPSSAVADLGLGSGWSQLDQSDMAQGTINALKTGIKFADRVSTVSPTYAREICDTALGVGMQHALRARPDRVVGILNGVDYQIWDPRHDPHLEAHFGREDMRGKEANRASLKANVGLELAPSTPVVGMVSRLAEQKGFDLLLDALPLLLQARDFGLVIFGSGEARYVDFCRALALQHRGRVVFRDGYGESLAHLIEAGSDMFLMPSRYEPCGLSQMYSLRYGTIPVVRKTGGLADSVEHFDPQTGVGTGCVFNDYDVGGVCWAMNVALDWFADRTLWRQLMLNAMAKDFSWGRQIKEYEALYGSLLVS